MAALGADRAAAKCDAQHNYGKDFADRSFESLYQGGATNITEIVMKWFMEGLYYNRLTDKCTAKEVAGGFTTCGHYLVMVDARVSLLGCAIRQCKEYSSTNVVYCEYKRNKE